MAPSKKKVIVSTGFAVVAAGADVAEGAGAVWLQPKAQKTSEIKLMTVIPKISTFLI